MKNLLVLILICASLTASAQYNGAGRELVDAEVPEFVQVDQSSIHLQRAGEYRLAGIGCFVVAGAALATPVDGERVALDVTALLVGLAGFTFEVASGVQMIKASR